MCEFEESRKQIEEDGDREIQDMRVRYERWLKEERDGNLRMKGENGILKKKVQGYDTSRHHFLSGSFRERLAGEFTRYST